MCTSKRARHVAAVDAAQYIRPIWYIEANKLETWKTLVIEMKWSPIRIGPLGTGRHIKSRCLDAFGWKICRTYVDEWMPLLMVTVSTSPCLQVKAEKSIYKMLGRIWLEKIVAYMRLQALRGVKKPRSSGQSGKFDFTCKEHWMTKLDRTLYISFHGLLHWQLHELHAAARNIKSYGHLDNPR